MLTRSFLSLTLIVAFAFVFTACGDSDAQATNEDSTEQTTETEQVPPDESLNIKIDKLNGVTAQPARSSYDFKIAVTDVLRHYFFIRDALAANNFDQAKQQVLPFVESLSNVLDEEVNEAGGPLWQSQKNALIVQINTLNGAENIDGARQAFSDLSNTLVDIQKNLGSTAPELYPIYCASALNGQGASWLSADKTVKNPYSSSEPNCGEVGEDMAIKF